MHITIADKDGGHNVELTPDEEEKVKKQWKINEAERKAQEKAQKEIDKLADEGMDDLVKDLPPAQAAALKKKLNV